MSLILHFSVINLSVITEETTMSYKIGLIGMIGLELQEDRWGTLGHMAELGYQGIEGSVLVSDSKDEMKENRQRMSDLGLETVALSCSQSQEENLEKVIENAQILGSKYIVTYWADPATKDEALQLAEQLERMAVKCDAEGIRYLYHNHEHEFVPKLGDRGKECIHEILVDNTEKLSFQLDVAWCHFGGSDPVNVIRRIGHRIPELHVKDLSDDNIRGHFCSIGMGKVNCFGAIEAAAAKGAEWMVVEQDRPGLISLHESAIASILNIREAGLHQRQQ